MSGRRHRDDAGLSAVERVRGVRERDSRIGLQQASAITEQRETDAAQAQQRLDDEPLFQSGTTIDFHSRRTALAALAAQVQRSREAAEASRATTEEARRRWQRDRSRLRAVQTLLDRRADARRAEATRKENHELDDVAGRMWLRRQLTEPPNGGAA